MAGLLTVRNLDNSTASVNLYFQSCAENFCALSILYNINTTTQRLSVRQYFDRYIPHFIFNLSDNVFRL